MKVESHIQDVERIGVDGEQEFKIRTTAKAFDILSSGIYSDPIMAVIRELSCNAYDAHVAAGKKDTPFEIHLPSKLEPWFSVIDHGTGLSDEDARGLFTTYFESTKTDTNDQIGAFGLGSKSPFSYTKAFDVICRYKGNKRTYSIFLNEQGVPTIATLANIKTDECNGVEVKITVRNGDYTYFREKVARGLRYFPVKPIVKGSAGFRFADLPKDVIKGDGYYSWKSDNWSKSFTAVQGNVPYKVDFDQISNHMSMELKEFLDDYKLVGFFDIGMLDIAASREEVRYDERTIKNLIDMMEKARIDWLKTLDKEVTALTKKGSKWDVFSLLQERFRYGNNVKTIAGSFKFKSKLFNQWIKDPHVVIDAGKYHTIKAYKHGHGRAVPQQFSQKTIEDTTGNGNHTRVDIERPSNNIAVFLNDVTKRSSIRINNWLHTASGTGEVIAIAPKSERVLMNAGITVPSQAQRTREYNAILKRLGNPTILTLSEETEDVTTTGTRRSKTGHTFKKYEPRKGYVRNSDRRKPDFVEVSEPKDGGIYVQITLHRDTVMGIEPSQFNLNDNTFSSIVSHMLSVVNHVKGTDYDIKDVHGLTKKVAKSVSGDDDWSSVDELYRECAGELDSLLEVRGQVDATDDDIGVADVLSRDEFHKMVNKLNKNSPFRLTVEPAIEATKVIRDATSSGLSNNTIGMITRLNHFAGIERKDIDAKPFFSQDDFKMYPMLKHSGMNINYQNDIDDIIEYIKLVEKK